MSVRPIWRALVPLTALATSLGLAATAQASTTQAAAAKAKPKGTEISVANTVFGPALVVGWARIRASRCTSSARTTRPTPTGARPA